MNVGRQQRIENLWRELEAHRRAEGEFGTQSVGFSVATYGTILERMRRKVPRIGLEKDGQWTRPLRQLRLEEADNWVMSLLECWALVGHVLGFYQERIATEGFLSTATQELSIRELLRMVDYQSFPGVAASALPAFLVSGAPGMPSPVEIPARARIQGVPLGNQLPQIFQTVAPVAGRAEWNRMSAYVPQLSVVPALLGADTSISLAGFESSLRPGDPLLLSLLELDGSGAPSLGATPTERLRQIKKTKRRKAVSKSQMANGVTARQALRSFDGPATDVELTEALDTDSPDRPLRLEAAFDFEQRARLFGYDAPAWSTVSDAVRRRYAPILGGVQFSSDDGSSWQAAVEGLAKVEVSCLAVAGPRLFAGTAKGLYRRLDDDLVSDSSSDSSGGWQLLTNGLGRSAINTLTALRGGAAEAEGDSLFVANTRGQVYHSADGGESWAPIQGRTEPATAGVLALIKNSLSKATAPLHLKRQPVTRPSLPVGPVHALLATSSGATNSGATSSGGSNSGGSNSGGSSDLFAGTDSGVFRFRLPSTGWQGVSEGLPGFDAATGQAMTSVRALVAEPGGSLLLGCDQGIFRSSDGDCWQAAGRGLPSGTSVSCLVGYSDGRRRQATYFAGTSRGVFRSDDPQQGWSATSLGLIDPAPDAVGPPAVTALTARLDPRDLSHHVFAGTASGLYRSSDRAENWGRLDSLRPRSKIEALATDSVGRVLASMPFAGFASDDWPNFHLQAGAIDLDRVYPNVVAGGWVVLRQPASVGGVPVAVFEIERVVEVERQDFELSAQVTRLVVDDDGTLESFDLRSTQVFVGSRAIEPWRRQVPDLRPVTGDRLRVAPPLDALPETNRQMIVSGRRSRAQPARDCSWRSLRAGTTPPGATEEVQVLSLRRQDGEFHLSVEDRLGRILEVAARRINWLPADPDDVEVGQAVSLAGTLAATSPTSGDPDDEAGQEDTVADAVADAAAAVSLAESGEGAVYSTFDLADALQLVLDPTTVSLWGNVSEANQGQQVSVTLGSGDAARALQRFPLQQPLTYVAAANQNGYRSTLDVEVAGTRWQEVEHLAEVDGNAHVYMVRPDMSGMPTIIFGDGTNGARLPSGRGNVLASYRTGMWPEALAPHQLSVLQTRPLGLRHADNPLATEPGAPPERQDQSRRRMPHWLRPLGRLVTLPDFQDFVSQNTAVARALVAPLHIKGWPHIQITLAGLQGQEIPPRGELYRQLRAAIENERAPGRPVRLDNYQPVRWQVGLRLVPDGSKPKAELAESVRATLLARFGFEQAAFGQRLYVGQVVDAAFEVPGVRAAEATSFGVVATGWPTDSTTDSTATDSTATGTASSTANSAAESFQAAEGYLHASLASVDRATGRVRPAQLLRLEKISIEVAS